MDDDPLIDRMNAALRQARDLHAEALRIQRDTAARLAEVRRSSTGLRDAMDRSLALRLFSHRARPGGRAVPPGDSQRPA